MPGGRGGGSVRLLCCGPARTSFSRFILNSASSPPPFLWRCSLSGLAPCDVVCESGATAAAVARAAHRPATMVGLKPRGGFNRGFWSDRRNQSSLKPENALNRAARTLADPCPAALAMLLAPFAPVFAVSAVLVVGDACCSAARVLSVCAARRRYSASLLAISDRCTLHGAWLDRCLFF